MHIYRYCIEIPPSPKSCVENIAQGHFIGFFALAKKNKIVDPTYNKKALTYLCIFSHSNTIYKERFTKPSSKLKTIKHRQKKDDYDKLVLVFFYS